MENIISIIEEFKQSQELTNDVIASISYVIKNDIAEPYDDIVKEFIANGFVDRWGNILVSKMF
jgi:hypothetical protein